MKKLRLVNAHAASNYQKIIIENVGFNYPMLTRNARLLCGCKNATSFGTHPPANAYKCDVVLILSLSLSLSRRCCSLT
jgi:hypothetical protein